MPIDVLTNRNDNRRSSTYLEEVLLSPKNVNVNQFGKLFDRTVNGDVYAQPLVVSGLDIPKKGRRDASKRNVVYVATTRNWVYAFDADDPLEFEPLWARNFGPPIPRADYTPALGGGVLLNFSSELGIVSTPVIRRSGSGGTIYFIARTKKIKHSKKAGESDKPEYFAKVHALDIRTGEDATASSTIKTSFKATLGNKIEFDPFMQLNRPGLLLMKDDTGKDVVYSAWSSQGDAQPFYGWILAHDADTLDLLATHCTTPDWGEGGIWQSGNGIGGDDQGFVYYVSGNGASDFDHGFLNSYHPFLAIAPPQPSQLKGWDLRLLTSADDVKTASQGAKKLIILADLGGVFQFGIFDDGGNMVLGLEEKWLKDQGPAINELKKALANLWPPHPLTDLEKAGIIESITSIVGPTLQLKVAPPGFGSSIVKLKFTRDPKAPEKSSLTVADSYTPSNTTAGAELVEGTPAAPLNAHDFDLCAGPVLFQANDKDNKPLDLVIGGGKNGRFYVLDRKGLGGWEEPTGPVGEQIPHANPKALQEERLCHYHIHGAPVFWEGAPGVPAAAYVWSEQDHLRAFAWDAPMRKFNSTAFAISEFGFAEGEMLMPGGFIAISANGSQPNTGIIWASHPTEDANNATVPGVLRAYDASTLQVSGNQKVFKELWNSDHDPLKPDQVGMFAKFVPPVVANGKVYLATFSRQLVVYGELPGAKQPNSMSMDMSDPGPRQNAFYAQTVGNIEVLGSVAGTCERLIVLAAGADIGGSSDEFQFYGQIRNGAGPIEVTALVHSIQDDDPMTKAGVMIRVSPGNANKEENRLVPGSPHASMLITSDGRPMFISRGAPNASSLVMPLPPIQKLPYWVRLRSKPVVGQGFYEVSGSISSDGNNWQTVGNPVRIAGLTSAVNSIAPTLFLQAGAVLAAHDDPTKTLDDLRVAIFRELDITDYQLDQT